MYLKNIKIYNNGPISSFDIRPKFQDGRPVPLVIIGENGTGKSILSSYLADFFIELAKPAFTNVKKQYPNFYRVVGTKNTQTGKDYSLVALECMNDEDKYYYFEVSGKAKDNWPDIESRLKEYNLSDETKEKIKCLNNDKLLLGVYAGEIKSKKDMSKSVLPSNIICYFPPDRKENPFWISNKEQAYETTRPTYNRTKYVNVLYNPVISETSSYENALWIASIVNDCSIEADIKRNSKKYEQNVNEIVKSSLALKNMLQNILQKIMKSRNLEILKDSRKSDQGFDILFSRNGKGVFLKNLSQLSNGEAVLFNLFVTILRYVDESGNISEVFNCESIKGIVVIDEIDVHLDTDLQYEVLPELIAMFPNIQFVITTHSSLFLLGLQNKKLHSNFDYQLVEMPNGNEIGVERFSEFKKAYNVMKRTAKYESELRKATNSLKENAILIVTEGKTDHLHLERALNKFKTLENKYEDLNLVFLNDLIGDSKSCGKSNLNIIKDFLSKDPIKTRKYFFMYDRDSGKKDIVFNQDGILTEGNICSFKIPIPEFRKNDISSGLYDESQITIEHYYTDDEIKTSVNIEGLDRRLFIANEFDNNQIHKTDDYYVDKSTLCGEHNIHIIDGGGKGKVYKNSSKGQHNPPNYALSKNLFYEKVVADDSKNIGYENFAAIFDLISKELMKMK